MKMTMKALLAGVSGAALVASGGAIAENRGVTDTEVVVGTHTALTGPVAPWGAGSVAGLRMAFAEANAKGGIHGRKIKLIVEDHGYQVPKAIQAANKLLNRDKIFAMIAALGTPMNNAVLPRQIKAGVPNFGPFTSARQMSQPFHRLKFQTLASYYDQVRAATNYFVKEKGVKKVCVMYQDTDYGREIYEAVRDQLKTVNMKIAAQSTHSPREKSFVGAITKLRKAGCDVTMLGTIITDTILPFVTAKKLGWKTTFVGNVATYDLIVAGFKKGLMNGYYAMTSFEMIYPDTTDPVHKAWAEAYKKRYGKTHSGAGQLGYAGGETFVEVLKRAGRNLTTDSFIKAAESLKGYTPSLGGPPLTFGPKDHHGSNEASLAIVENGRWKNLTKPLSY